MRNGLTDHARGQPTLLLQPRKKTRMANLTGEAQESTNFYGKRSRLLAVFLRNEIDNNVPKIGLFQLSLPS